MDRREQLVKNYHHFLHRSVNQLLATNELAGKIGTRDDWYQEAAIALLEADERFDASMGFKFITFATKWVWGRLRSAVRDYGGVIRVSASGAAPDSRYHDKADAAFAIRSLHDQDGELSPHCDLPTRDQPEPMLGDDQMYRLLRVLDKRDAEVIRKRYGFDGPPRSLQELSDEMGVTKERVRQIERRALDRMEGVPLTL